MKRIKLILPLIAVMLFSCDNYMDINDSPNNLEFADATPKKLLPGAQVTTFRVQTLTMNTLGNVFMNSWAGNVSAFTGGYAREFQLNIDNGFYNGIWDGLYRNIMNFQAIIDYPNPDGKYDYYVAVAKICKAHYTQYIVDLYGDAPFTEAWKGGANTTPAYNDDQFIYRQLIADLEDARALIDNAASDAEDIADVDVMLYGDYNAWYEFANTIELRMLLRMSNNTGAVAAYRDSKLATLSSASFISQDITINPGYNNSTDAQQSPFWGAFYADSSNNAVQNLTFVTASGHYYKSLFSYANYPTGASTEIIAGSGVNYPNVNDPRRLRILRNGAGQSVFRAVTQGSTMVDVYPPSASIGTPARTGWGTYNPYNAAPLTFDDLASVDGYVMTLSEAYFLRAEAALRWPGLFSGDQFYFNQGIAASMAYRGASDGGYTTAINAIPNFGYNAAYTFNQKLHAIMYQKWIALIGVHGIESYIDYTRTGYPLTPLATTATYPNKPKRLIYPVSEYVANSANVPDVPQADAFVVNSFSPFWLQGDPALGN